MNLRNFKIISTSHIAKSSVNEIEKAFKNFEPDVIAVELDINRMQAMLSNQESDKSLSMIRHIGVLGYLFLLVGSFLQKKLGNIVGTMPGLEMKTAVLLSRKTKKQLFLIDQNIQITLKNLSKKVPAREKWRIVWELMAGFFKKGPKISIDLNKVPDEKIIEFLKKEMRKKLPIMYKILVSDRNRIMAKNLLKIESKYPNKKILVVMGAGHSKEIIKILQGN